MPRAPILERIRQDVLAALRAVTKTNGYTFNCTADTRKQNGPEPRDLLLVLYQANTNTTDTPALRRNERFQRFSVDCYSIIGEQDAEVIDADERLNHLQADVEKALAADRTRGGLAIDTHIRDPELFTHLGDATEGVTVNVDVHYRTNEDDPYKAN